MDLEDIMLSEISQRKTNTIWYHLHVKSKKIQQTSKYNKYQADSLTDIENELEVTVGRGKGEGQYKGGTIGDSNYYV